MTFKANRLVIDWLGQTKTAITLVAILTYNLNYGVGMMALLSGGSSLRIDFLDAVILHL